MRGSMLRSHHLRTWSITYELVYAMVSMNVGPCQRHGASSGCGWRNGLQYE